MRNSPIKNRTSLTKTIEVISTVASVLAGLLTLLALFPSTRSLVGLKPSLGMDGGLASQAQIEIINSEIAGIKQEQTKLNDQINALSQTTSQNVLASDVAGLKTSLNNVDERLTKIESVIVQDPQSALEIPLLRKDLENISTTTELQIAAIRQDIDRSYNLVFATIVSLVIAVLASAIGNMFKKDKEGKAKE